MWSRIPRNLWMHKVINVRTYARRGRNNDMGQVMKTIDVKVTSPLPKAEELPKRRQREQLFENKEFEEDPESFGDFESDFMQVHKSQRKHELEAIQHKEKVRHWIVKNKYFKEKLPDFLTYAEKEQIKSLNRSDPEEWTPEKLSECFPANPVTIAKVIKANWSARTEERIKLHDQSVMKNWVLFREGKLPHLDQELKEHLQRFANRSIEDLKGIETGAVDFPQLPTPKSSEFVSIITSCKDYKEPAKLSEPVEQQSNKVCVNNMEIATSRQGEDSFVMGNVRDRRRMRLQDLKDMKIVASKAEDEPTLPVNDSSEPEKSAILQPLRSTETTEVVVSKEDMKTYEMNSIKEKIHIPRKLWKSGATYKVEDCYYDDDGEFLYRVPGMTGRKI